MMNTQPGFFSAPRRRAVALAFSIILVTGISRIAVANETRVWTSIAGTKIEAEHVGSIGNEVWLRSKDGRLIKVRLEQLAIEERGRLHSPAAMALDWSLLEYGPLVDTRKDADFVEVAELLLGTTIPTYSSGDVLLEEALESYTDVIAANDPLGRRVKIRVDPACRQGLVKITMRNLSAMRALQIICANQPEPLVARIIDGGVEIVPKSHAVRVEEIPSATVAIGGVERPRGSMNLPVPMPSCQSLNIGKNWLLSGDFELKSNAWEMVNQPKAFRRSTLTVGEFHTQASSLGDRVMSITPLPPDVAKHDGPPYLVQTVTFPRKPKRVLVCLDLFNESAESINVRFSASDPDVSYLHGSGNTFPFLHVSVKRDPKWQHLEWEADLTKLENDKLTFGLMFPSRGGPWHCDNVTLRVLEE